MKIKLSQIVTKVPSTLVEVTSIDLSQHELTGLAVLECTLFADHEGVGQDLVAMQIPVQITTKELLELFNVTKVAGNTRRRLK
tara:strand:+ start:38675 stop:38923 length:249 start_codon:yes stop_codon:yes gene_type:complete